MVSLAAMKGSAVSGEFLRKLIGFYRPRALTAQSTAFDMGYEQARRDLRVLLVSEIPDLREYENFDAEQVEERSLSPWVFARLWKKT